MYKKTTVPIFFCLFLSLLFFTCKKPPEIEYTILPTSLSFDASGGADEFLVSVKSPAIVESIEVLDAWCQVSKNGISPVNVIVTVDANNTKELRTAQVIVGLKLDEVRVSATVKITQEGMEFDEGVLIHGIKWATRNVDAPGKFAAHPEDVGMFYQWNRRVGWSSTEPIINSNGGTTWDNSKPDVTWNKTNDPCPPGWRVPTLVELSVLGRVIAKWTTINGVEGCILSGDNGLLFFPITGSRYYSDGTLYTDGYGYYWSSSVSIPVDISCAFFFNSYSFGLGDGRRTSGYSVRCVEE